MGVSKDPAATWEALVPLGLTNAFLIVFLAFVLISSRTNAVRIRYNKLTSSVEKQLEIENFGLQLQNYNMLVELTGAGLGSKPIATAYDVGDALSLQNTINEKNRSFQYPNCHPKTAMCDDHRKQGQIKCEDTLYFSGCISDCRDRFLHCVSRYEIIQEKLPHLGRTAKYLRRELIMNPLYEKFRKNRSNYMSKSNAGQGRNVRDKAKTSRKMKKMPDLKKLIQKKMSKVMLPMQMMKKQLKQPGTSQKQAELVVNNIPSLKKGKELAEQKALKQHAKVVARRI